MSEPWEEDTASVLRGMQRSVDAARAEAPTGDTAAEAPVGTGEALRGLVRVRVTGQRVSEVYIDPRAMHRTAQDVAAGVAEATNAAFDDLRAALTTELPRAPELDEVSRTLREVSTDSMRALRAANAGVQRSMAAIQRISELHRGNR